MVGMRDPVTTIPSSSGTGAASCAIAELDISAAPQTPNARNARTDVVVKLLISPSLMLKATQILLPSHLGKCTDSFKQFQAI
jgi:hypothetical protein